MSQSPSKSIRSQIENAAQYPEGYAERAKMVYQMAEQEKWNKEQTMEMLRDPAKFARFVEIVYLSLLNLFIRKNYKTPQHLTRPLLACQFLIDFLKTCRGVKLKSNKLKSRNN